MKLETREGGVDPTAGTRSLGSDAVRYLSRQHGVELPFDLFLLPFPAIGSIQHYKAGKLAGHSFSKSCVSNRALDWAGLCTTSTNSNSPRCESSFDLNNTVGC